MYYEFDSIWKNKIKLFSLPKEKQNLFVGKKANRWRKYISWELWYMFLNFEIFVRKLFANVKVTSRYSTGVLFI